MRIIFLFDKLLIRIKKKNYIFRQKILTFSIDKNL